MKNAVQVPESGALSADKVKFSPTSLQITEGISYEEWQDIALCAGTMNKATHWWIGDALLYGEANYGEKYAQVMEDLGLAYSTLANVVHTCKMIPPEQRREGLSFTAHQEVSSLPYAEREKHLAVAEKEGLTSKELRERVRGKELIKDVLIPCKITVHMDTVDLAVPSRVLDNFVAKHKTGGE